ncbi:MAG: ribonuclease P protein component [Burkholderiales bacterium]|nr:ribonuclease P protein component [Burkholderiales bacterium]
MDSGGLRRLTGQGAFETVFRTGRRVEGLYLTLIAAPAPVAGGRLGLVVGRKVSPRAVDRNRIKRKLREAARANPAALARHDVVLRVSRARNRAEQDLCALEAARLLTELAARACATLQ